MAGVGIETKNMRQRSGKGRIEHARDVIEESTASVLLRIEAQKQGDFEL